MNFEPDPELESLVDGGLTRLSPLTAPRTLIPNVLALLDARRVREWWRRAWWHWPVAAQAAFLIFALALVTFASTGSWVVSDGLVAVAQQLGGQLSLFPDLGQRFAPLTETGLVLAEKFGASLLHYGSIAVVLAYVTCLGTGTVLVRLVWKRN